jgi:SurA N-terminal domain
LSRSLLLSIAGFAIVLTAGCGATASGSSSAAASVNGHDISMAAYNHQVAFQRISNTDSTGYDVCTIKAWVALCRQLKQTALNTLIDNELVREYAASHHIAVSNADFQARWRQVYKGFQDSSLIYHAKLAHLHMTDAEYKATLRQSLLQQAVLYLVTQKMPTRIPAVLANRIDVANQKAISGIRARLRSGTSFDTVAAALTRKPKTLCHRIGCAPGWLPDILIVGPERRAITSPAGTVLGPVRSAGTIELLEVKGHSRTYSLTPAQQLSVRTKLFNRWLGRQRLRASVKRYVAT